MVLLWDDDNMGTTGNSELRESSYLISTCSLNQMKVMLSFFLRMLSHKTPAFSSFRSPPATYGHLKAVVLLLRRLSDEIHPSTGTDCASSHPTTLLGAEESDLGQFQFAIRLLGILTIQLERYHPPLQPLQLLV